MEYFAFQQQPYIQLCLIIDDGLALKVSAENAWLSKWWILQMRMKISMWIFTWKIDRKWMFKWHCDNDELANVSVQDARMFEKVFPGRIIHQAIASAHWSWLLWSLFKKQWFWDQFTRTDPPLRNISVGGMMFGKTYFSRGGIKIPMPLWLTMWELIKMDLRY